MVATVIPMLNDHNDPMRALFHENTSNNQDNDSTVLTKSNLPILPSRSFFLSGAHELFSRKLEMTDEKLILEDITSSRQTSFPDILINLDMLEIYRSHLQDM